MTLAWVLSFANGVHLAQLVAEEVKDYSGGEDYICPRLTSDDLPDSSCNTPSGSVVPSHTAVVPPEVFSRFRYGIAFTSYVALRLQPFDLTPFSW